MGSSAFLLPMEARGLYREMLTQAWRRGAWLPNDPVAIQRAVGATNDEWMRSWPFVARFWRIDGDKIVNDTQVEIYTIAATKKGVFEERARKAAELRWHASSNASSIAQALLEQCPPISDLRSPSLKKASGNSKA